MSARPGEFRQARGEMASRQLAAKVKLERGRPVATQDRLGRAGPPVREDGRATSVGRRTTTCAETTGPATDGAVVGPGCRLRRQRWRGLTPPTSFSVHSHHQQRAIASRCWRRDARPPSGCVNNRGRSAVSKAAGDGCGQAARSSPRGEVRGLCTGAPRRRSWHRRECRRASRRRANMHPCHGKEINFALDGFSASPEPRSPSSS